MKFMPFREIFHFYAIWELCHLRRNHIIEANWWPVIFLLPMRSFVFLRVMSVVSGVRRNFSRGEGAVFRFFLGQSI